MKPILGTAGGKPLAIDVERLLATRALLTASSGAGKSWALRRLLEQTHGRGAMQLVIDPEGEFPSLREKLDLVIAGKGGGCPAEPRSADLLARRLLELGTSAVLDLYELSRDARVSFVRRFLEALIDAPKKLWRPALVVIDEAHMFAPEDGKNESRDAVRGLMTRGRKRGFAGLLATQRLAKLDKDSCDCGNVMIGRFTLDVDVKRAAEQLGFAKARHVEIQRLGLGEFFCYGTALSAEVVCVQVGEVVTTHPKAGQHVATPPAPREKVQKVLAQLADLPAEAEAEAKTAAELRVKVRELEGALKRQIAIVGKAPAPDPDGLERARSEGRNQVAQGVAREAQQLVARYRKALESAMQFIIKVNAEGFGHGAGVEPAEIQKALEAAGASIARLVEQKLDARNRTVERIQKDAERILEALKLALGADVTLDLDVRHQAPVAVTPARVSREVAPSAEGITPVMQKILDALAELEALGTQQPEREMVAMLAGYTHLQSKGFVNACSVLSTSGRIEYPGNGTIKLTEDGRAVARPPDVPRASAEIQERVIRLLGGASERILRPLIEAYPKALPREDVAAAAGYGHLQSKGFVNAMSRLSSLGFVHYPNRGEVAARPVLFLEAP